MPGDAYKPGDAQTNPLQLVGAMEGPGVIWAYQLGRFGPTCSRGESGLAI